MAVLGKWPLRSCILATLSLGLICVGTTSAEDEARFGFERSESQLVIRLDDKPFATYVWDDPVTTRPYFKQVFAAGGKIQVTRNHPPKPGDLRDHATYHPGIFWGFGDVDGNDYWRLKAKVVGGHFTKEPWSKGPDAGFTVRNKMLMSGSDEVFCTQVCDYQFAKTSDGIVMICSSSMQRNESDFWLGDQEEMGLAFRTATALAIRSGKGGSVVNSLGDTSLSSIRTKQANWCDYGGPVAGKLAGIMMMNDPSNFRKPWWHAVDTGQLVANPLGESELNGRGKKRKNVLVEKGKPFRLRYGVLIHLHDDAKDFNRERAYDTFLASLK